jgi:FkbM family methyltransferase
MTFISYAQNFEDVMLWRALKDVPDGFYVDVGAYSPTLDSVTRAFYDRGWRGINIEPNPVFYAMLESERLRDINLQLAIGNNPCSKTLKVFENTGLATLSEEIAAQHVVAGWPESRVEVRIETLARILAAHVPKERDIHFLKIDVEGLEEEVIRSADFRMHRPWIVVVEATRPQEQHLTELGWESHLVAQGYVFVYFDGLNRFYVAEEKRELAKAFSVPPNIFDDFIQVKGTRQLAELVAIRFPLAWRMSKPLRWLARQARRWQS